MCRINGGGLQLPAQLGRKADLLNMRYSLLVEGLGLHEDNRMFQLPPEPVTARSTFLSSFLTVHEISPAVNRGVLARYWRKVYSWW